MATVGNLQIKIGMDASALRKGASQATDEVRRMEKSMGSAEGAATSTTAAVQKQDSALKAVAHAAHNAHIAHSVYSVTQHGVAAATGNTVAHTSNLATALNVVKQGAAKVSAAFKVAAARVGAFAARVAPAAAALAPFAIGAGIVAGLVAMNKALIKVAASAANIAPVADAFDRLARGIGTFGEALRSDLQAAVAGTVPGLELMQSSVIALNSGAIKSRETLVELAEGARILGRTVGVDTAEAFDRLIRAIGLQNPQLLKSLGILVSVDEATRSYARELGVAASSLTEVQEKEAFRVAVLEKMRGATGRVGDSTDDLQTSLQRSAAAGVSFTRGMKNAVAEAEGLKAVAQDMSLLKQAASEFAVEVAGPVVTAITNAAAKTLSWATGPLSELVDKLQGANEELETLNSNLEDSVIEGVSTRAPIPTPALPTKAFVDFADKMERIIALQSAMGDLFDASAARQSALKKAIQDAIDQGWDPLSDRVQGLVRQLEAFNAEVDRAVVGSAAVTGITGQFPGRQPDTGMPDPGAGAAPTMGFLDTMKDSAGKVGGVLKSMGKSVLGVLKAINPWKLILDALSHALGDFLRNMTPIVEMIGSALTPILKALFPIFKGVTIAATYLGQVLFNVAGGITKAIGWAIRTIGKAIDLIPFVSGDSIIKAGQSMMDLGDGFIEAASQLAQARDEIKDLEWTEAADNVSDLGDAASEAAAALRNAPSGFKIALERFRATNPRTRAMPGQPGGPGPNEPNPGTDFTTANRSTPPIIVQVDGRTLFEIMEGEARRARSRGGNNSLTQSPTIRGN